ncbi:protein takeout-like [Leptinotarsa decemlineata]|uniref:protein takeout-like n=1 Tax=Leptinotarsa decemlineata TaxID=7539 RepID=UPI003D304DA2
MKMVRVLLICFTLVLAVTALHRPKYLEPCSKTHNFTACALDHAKKAIPHLLNGDKHLKIPPMNPLRISLVDLQGGKNFHLLAKNIKVFGLDKVEVLDIDVDFDKMEAHTLSTVPRLEILSDYEMTGHLMIFPINGHGPANITLLNGLYQYNFRWEREYRNGEEYAKLANSSYDYKLRDVHYDFKNLFDGNEILSNEINKVLNDNWELVNEDLKQSILETLLVIHNDIFRKIYLKVPFRELFLP